MKVNRIYAPDDEIEFIPDEQPQDNAVNSNAVNSKDDLAFDQDNKDETIQDGAVTESISTPFAQLSLDNIKEAKRILALSGDDINDFLEGLSEEELKEYFRLIHQHDTRAFERIFNSYTDGMSKDDCWKLKNGVFSAPFRVLPSLDSRLNTEQPVQAGGIDKAEDSEAVAEEQKDDIVQIVEEQKDDIAQVVEQSEDSAKQKEHRSDQQNQENHQVAQARDENQQESAKKQQQQGQPQVGGGFSLSFGGNPSGDKPGKAPKAAPATSAQLTDGIQLRSPAPSIDNPVLSEATKAVEALAREATPTSVVKPVADEGKPNPSVLPFGGFVPKTPRKDSPFESYFKEIEANNNDGGWHDQKSSVPFRGQVLNAEAFALKQREALLAKGISRLNANPADMEIIKRANAAEHEQLLDRLDIKKRAMSAHEDAVKDSINHFKNSALTSVLPKLMDANTPAERAKVFSELMTDIKRTPEAESQFQNEFKTIRENLTHLRESTLDYAKALVESGNEDEAMGIIDQFKQFSQKAVKDSHMDEFQKDKSYSEAMKEWSEKMTNMITRLIQSLTGGNSESMRA